MLEAINAGHGREEGLPPVSNAGNAKRIRSFLCLFHHVSGLFMRTTLMPGFQLAVDYWFDRVLQGMGDPIREWIYDFLNKKGISREDIPGRFEDVVKTLMERLGSSARVIAYRTVVELYKEFALPPNFEYDDSLPDRFVYFKERVVADRLHPTTPSLRFPA